MALLVLTFAFPPLTVLLSLAPLGGLEIMVVAGIAVMNLVVIEVGKYVLFRKSRAHMEVVEQYV